ncbi:hypothetical protein TRFO_16337 [Tritrichomonas foetus]|uniref:Uncharacterized protein n=1 Tax=Tritrichomonas foetus TaxID=1144522 RepID=A0A1J4KQA2_9EUKA|nr:hypothetical protein TRFO_16337 [Tritrichomonas foetus]|eukprot:OHT13471.1 hypothetical protein TRFO_16337 [Tritrichomonas foetus]
MKTKFRFAPGGAVRKSSPLPFTRVNILNDNENKNVAIIHNPNFLNQKQAPSKSLLSIKQSPRNIVKPVKPPNLNRRRIRAPFATDTPPIESPRRKPPNIANKPISDNQNQKKVINEPFQNFEKNIPNKSPRKHKNIIKQLNEIPESLNNELNLNLNNDLNIIVKQTDFGQADLPIPPSSSRPFKISHFTKRISRIDEILIQHKLIMKKLNELITSKISKNCQNLSSVISETVEKPYNEIFSRIIPNMTGSLFERNSYLDIILDKYEKILQNDNFKINESLTEQKVLIGNFSNKLQTFFDSSQFNGQFNISEHINENHRLNDKIESTMKNLADIENSVFIKSASTIHYKDELNHLKNSLDDQFHNFAQSIQTLNDTEFRKHSEKVGNEVIENKNFLRHYSNEVNQISDQISNKFTQLKEIINEETKSISEQTKLIEDDINKSIQKVNDESNSYQNNLNETLEKAIDNSQKNFEVFRNETVQTIETIKSQFNEQNENFLKRIEDEMEHVQKNPKDVYKKFDNFTYLIENEKNIQIRHFAETFIQSSNQKVDENIQTVVKTDMILFSKAVEKIDESEKRLNEIEERINQTQKNFSKFFDEVHENLALATQKIHEINESNNNSFSEIEKKLTIIENKPNKKDSALKPEIIAMFNISKTSFEEKYKNLQNLLQNAQNVYQKVKNECQNNCINNSSNNQKKTGTTKKVIGIIETAHHFENPPVDLNHDDYYSDEDVF